MASSFWTEDKIEFLRGIYQGKTNRELAEICSQEFGRSFTPAALHPLSISVERTCLDND